MKKILPILATTLLLSSFSVAQAQESLPLVVAPARQQMTIDPGKSQSSVIKFFNQATVPVSGTVRAVDFVVTGSSGAPLLFEEPVSNRYSASTWVSLPYERASIPAGGTLTVPFTIKAPQNALAGGRYIAIYFEQTGYNLGVSTNPNQSGESAVTPRIVGLVSIRVSGPITESAQIIKLTTPRFLEYGPVKADFEIANRGNYHITPKGSITLTDMFGKEVASKAIEEKNVFPERSRTYETLIGNRLLIGSFKVTLKATYGDRNQALIASTHIFLFPWKVTLAILLAITILIVTAVIVYLKVVKKEKNLQEALIKEEKELEELKEQLKDKISGNETPKK